MFREYILSICLILAGCTAEMYHDSDNAALGKDEILYSFSVDIPSFHVTKSTTGDMETIHKLALITFDADGNVLGRTIATPSSNSENGGDTYTARINVNTKSIQFIGNYDGSLNNIDNMEYVTTEPIDEFVFYGSTTINNYTDLGTPPISLKRNWSKISLSLNMGDTHALTDISYCVYRQSKHATIASQQDGMINLPSTFSPGEESNWILAEPNTGFVSHTEPIYLFENDNQTDTPSFIILRGKYYNNSADYTYYKIDLSVSEENISTVYDVIRNYWFQVSLNKVNRKGCTWEEVIAKGKLPDYNILTSVVLMKYPSISWGSSSLEVSPKTTYVCTEAQDLTIGVAYKENGTLNNEALAIFPSATDVNISQVIKNGFEGITLNKATGEIKLSINPLPEGIDKPITTSFYVKGGDLHRKITLILRKPYEFEAVSLSPSSISDDASKKDITLRFTVPEDIEESLLPFECTIYSKYLYSVQEGIKIETNGGDGCKYIYKIKEKGLQTVLFRLSPQNQAISEELRLSADLFKTASHAYSAAEPQYREIRGTIQCKNLYNSQLDPMHWDVSTAYYTIENSNDTLPLPWFSYDRYSLKVLEAEKNKQITFYCISTTSGEKLVVYKLEENIAALLSNPNLVFNSDPITTLTDPNNK